MFSNDSFIAEHWHDQFAPNDSREESIMECPECSGQRGWSKCCGASVHNHICYDCKETCAEVTCPKCKGDGVIDL